MVMVMSKEEFATLYNENSVRLTGRLPKAANVDKAYQGFLDLKNFTEADDGTPIFFRGKRGGLDWDFQPVRRPTP
jgi:hypothetical protein